MKIDKKFDSDDRNVSVTDVLLGDRLRLTRKADRFWKGAIAIRDVQEWIDRPALSPTHLVGVFRDYAAIVLPIITSEWASFLDTGVILTRSADDDADPLVIRYQSRRLLQSNALFQYRASGVYRRKSSAKAGEIWLAFCAAHTRK